MSTQYASKQSTYGNPSPGSRVDGWDENPIGRLQLTGAEAPLPEEEQSILDTVHRFSSEVVRPAGIALDRMSAEAVAAPDSPLWPVLQGYRELGLGLDLLMELPAEARARVLCLVMEELGWGDAGLAISLGTSMNPQLTAHEFGNQYLLDKYPETMLGCWAITQPDHGSDSLDVSKQAFHPQGAYGRPNCVVTLKHDRLVINGQFSAWVSNGTIAELCILYAPADCGEGADPERGCAVMVPLDAKGVSRGKPLEKMGQRALNQGEIFFDNVELSLDHLVAGPEHFKKAVYAKHVEANGLMGAIFTGTARSAFELALAYAHERKQGGVPIIRHQSVSHRLFHMFRKVEMARAITRRAVTYNYTQAVPALHVAMTSKVTATQVAFEVASEALQIFGGNGLTYEYPIEKILRDARASMIEDGCNELLAIKGGFHLVDPGLL
ncbi:acyl-CoA dehydrogenase family protein [Parahaliea mediterranea]|uniref:acyl-CoA dehydrogenase family protein n=1 Tax=Parahaliea mediterranea TaxID=651086 RepID=UPI0019D4C709|nr:acyl-CoA dehydrogenase [Parahaliea mediterranea]